MIPGLIPIDSVGLQRREEERMCHFILRMREDSNDIIIFTGKR
jgi:hypothetical protein